MIYAKTAPRRSGAYRRGDRGCGVRGAGEAASPEPRTAGHAAEMVLCLLVLKLIRNLSYAVLEREVRANLVYRDFTRVGGGKMPDAKTMGRWGLAVGPQVLKQIHDRIVKIAHEQGVVVGRRMRVDTTVVETNIHHPTDSTMLWDGCDC